MKKTKDNNLRTVYSTESGSACPDCGRPLTSCTCRKSNDKANAGDGTVRIRREVSGRGGKTVIVITGVPLAGDELKTLAKKLKKKCGTGGAVKNGNIEIQGEHRDTLLNELKSLGYNVKMAGG